ncbi:MULTISPECIES: tyrosine recombinase XerS [Oceanobacillus]|uniref:Tyrosine recombinase XerS n=1 Tax=Oceanobacillus kimchii TaxID=746691 RepID=A0ABQ5TSB0_9BACI|nr:tyrosine recombinase XerS [Oceanobacillus kimchii]GLO68380.1 tyrosine recombinase XerS [Oceanobacillus kimchii]
MPIGNREREVHQQRLDLLLPQLPDYVQEYVLSKKRAEYSPSTLLGYTHEYIKFFSWLQEEGFANVQSIKDIPYTLLESLRKEYVEYYIDFLKEEDIRTDKEKKQAYNNNIKKRSSVAVNRNINALKSLFNYLTQETENEEGECYFYRNVFSKIKTHKKQDTANRRARKISSTILNDQDIQDFILFLKEHYEEKLTGRKLEHFKKHKERDIAIISMLLGSGVRVSEIATLTLPDIDMQNKKIDIIRKGDKEDTVRVLPSALEDLKEYLKVRKERFKTTDDDIYVFVTKYGGMLKPISVRSIQNLVVTYTKAFNTRSEFSTGKGLSPHKLRHTFATDWIKNGGDIILLRDQLGHNTIETTSKYTNLSDKASEKVMEQIEKSRTNLKN